MSMRSWCQPFAAAFVVVTFVFSGSLEARGETVALWLFDEQQGLYPSCVLGDAATGDFPLVLGRGGRVVAGLYGNALQPADRDDASVLDGPLSASAASADGARAMTWASARFCGLMTRGEKHLRHEVGFGSPTRSGLNLGDFDWTVEFWYQAESPPDREGGTVFELGSGPLAGRGETIRLTLAEGGKGFLLEHSAASVRLEIPSAASLLDGSSGGWHHLAFVYDARAGQLRHYVDGRLQTLPASCLLRRIPEGEEDYLSIGRDAAWGRPLPGRLDELRFSDEQVYRGQYEPPKSFSRLYGDAYVAAPLVEGPPLLFPSSGSGEGTVDLGSRRHLLIDDALIEESQGISFEPHPPRPAEKVIDGIDGHLVVFEGDDGLIRLYYRGPEQSLAVMTSTDGVHWEKPDLGRSFEGATNVVIADPVGLGTIFVDPCAPPEQRIKYFSGYRGRGFYVYSSADGFDFRRNETSALPLRAASQSNIFYDDQRRLYVAYHRSDMAKTSGGKTERSFVRTETVDVLRPWPFRPLSIDELRAIASTRRVSDKIPWYLDNGPLTPPGFGAEYPTGFAADAALDPPATDIYVPKCIKYPWAPDTYLAFPVVYFHYQGDGPDARQVLGELARARGSGPTETQLAASRDGVDWRRYPRPAYIGNGRHAGRDIHMAYISHGMVRRGEEIWQYYLGSEQYHSPWRMRRKQQTQSVFRVVQRLDGFVSATALYSGGRFVTRPLVFEGDRLILNVDTDAAGYAQVGILDETGKAVAGFSADECVYINGDYVRAPVEWLDRGSDLSSLEGRTVRLEFRMRGSKLYSLQFVRNEGAAD